MILHTTPAFLPTILVRLEFYDVRFLNIRNTNKCSLPARRCITVSVDIPRSSNLREISGMLFCFIATR